MENRLAKFSFASGPNFEQFESLVPFVQSSFPLSFGPVFV